MPAVKGTITFVNASLFEASVYTVDAKGLEAFVVNLLSGQSSKQNTVAGQVWNVKDKGTGRQVGTITGTADDQTYEIKFQRGRGEPEQTRGGGG